MFKCFIVQREKWKRRFTTKITFNCVLNNIYINKYLHAMPTLRSLLKNQEILIFAFYHERNTNKIVFICSAQFIWLFSVTQLKAVTYGDYEYPTWAIVFGWMLGLISLIPIPVMMILAISREQGPFMEVSQAFTPI